DALGETGRAILSERLALMTGELLGGAGAEQLFAAVEAEYRRFFTGSGQQARDALAPLHAAQLELQEAGKILSDLEWRQREHDTAVDRHATLPGEVRTLEVQLPQLEAAVRAAEGR